MGRLQEERYKHTAERIKARGLIGYLIEFHDNTGEGMAVTVIADSVEFNEELGFMLFYKETHLGLFQGVDRNLVYAVTADKVVSVSKIE